MEIYKFPPAIINSYVWAQFEENAPVFSAQYGSIVPIFPVYDAKAGDASWGNKSYIVYDNMARVRSGVFYGVRKEQLVYSIRGDIPEIFALRDLITDVLDRGDDTAKDINEYAGENLENPYIFFHDFKVFQQDFTNEKTDKHSTRQFYSTDLIIEYQYHQQSIYKELG